MNKKMEEEFNDALNKLGELYEEGKDCLHQINIPVGHPCEKEYLRVYEILREMRDMSATQLQKIHFVNEN